MRRKSRCKSITFAEAKTNDGQRLLGVNDLFIGPKSHTSARYALQWHGQQEEQSSSGIIVSTGFGSSGWFKSILAGAIGVTGQQSHPLANGFEWQAKKLYFTVREPFPSRTSGAGWCSAQSKAKSVCGWSRTCRRTAWCSPTESKATTSASIPARS